MPKPEELNLKMYNALKRITQYQSAARLRKRSYIDYRLSWGEAIEYAYENVIGEAKAGLKGVRMPKPKETR